MLNLSKHSSVPENSDKNGPLIAIQGHKQRSFSRVSAHYLESMRVPRPFQRHSQLMKVTLLASIGGSHPRKKLIKKSIIIGENASNTTIM
jgi:hypothetical protein